MGVLKKMVPYVHDSFISPKWSQTSRLLYCVMRIHISHL